MQLRSSTLDNLGIKIRSLHMKAMTVDDLIKALSRKNQDDAVYLNFCNFRPTGKFCSYSGKYEQLAMNYSNQSNPLTVKQMIEALEGTIFQEYTGWTGGRFTMSDDTIVNVANPGERGDIIVDVAEHDTGIILITQVPTDACLYI